jgi:hypothetical protein
MTTTVLKVMTIAAATLVVAIALVGLLAPAAVRAGEYCSEHGHSFRAELQIQLDGAMQRQR